MGGEKKPEDGFNSTFPVIMIEDPTRETGTSQCEDVGAEAVSETDSGDVNLDANNPTGHARELVRQACGAWPGEQVSVAELLITELVANAFEHGRGLSHVRVELNDHLLHVEVSDPNSAYPRVVDPPPTGEDERGRGLLLVTTLASSWGARTETGFAGKTVWFDLSRFDS